MLLAVLPPATTMLCVPEEVVTRPQAVLYRPSWIDGPVVHAFLGMEVLCIESSVSVPYLMRS